MMRLRDDAVSGLNQLTDAVTSVTVSQMTAPDAVRQLSQSRNLFLSGLPPVPSHTF